jgi:hypothetical protein
VIQGIGPEFKPWHCKKKKRKKEIMHPQLVQSHKKFTIQIIIFMYVFWYLLVETELLKQNP